MFGNEEYKRVFVTHILSEKYIAEYQLATAGCNFSFNLMSGGAFSNVYSILPTNIGGVINPDCFNDSRFKLVYCSFFRRFGRLGIGLASLFEQLFIFYRIQASSSVWLYNVTDLNIFLIWLLRIFKRNVMINVIVLDFTPKQKMCNLYLRMINHSHGLITLSDSPLFRIDNCKLLPGVVPINAGNEPTVTLINKRFLLSGVLSEHIAQTRMVLKAFSQLPQCELHITGFCDDNKVIIEYASLYPNIIYHGRVSFEDYLQIMHSCTYQLSTRDKQIPENECNFPSKIIEALLHNRAVISTIAYRQIENINYFVVDSNLNTFIKQILNIVNTKNDVLMSYVNQGKKVSRLFSTGVWETTMKEIEEYSLN